MGGLNIDPESIEVPENQEFDNTPLPAGKYLCAVESAVDEPDVQSRSGATYSRVRLRFRCVDGEYANRCIFEDAIYEHPSAKAAEIGCEFLARLHAAGKCEGNITPESLLQSSLVVVTVKIEGSEQYGDKARVSYIAPVNTGGTSQPSSASARTEKASDQKPSW